MQKTIEDVMAEFGIDLEVNPFSNECPDEVTVYENE